MLNRYFLVTVGFAIIAVSMAACGQGSGTISGDQGTVPSSNDAQIDGYAELVDALRSAGAVVEPADEVMQPFFFVPGQVIEVNGAQVQVFEYADEAARQAESDTIAPDGSSVGTSMVTWIDQPHFWATGRLIVLYLGTNANILDLLDDTLGESITG